MSDKKTKNAMERDSLRAEYRKGNLKQDDNYKYETPKEKAERKQWVTRQEARRDSLKAKGKKWTPDKNDSPKHETWARREQLERFEKEVQDEKKTRVKNAAADAKSSGKKSPPKGGASKSGKRKLLPYDVHAAQKKKRGSNPNNFSPGERYITKNPHVKYAVETVKDLVTGAFKSQAGREADDYRREERYKKRKKDYDEYWGK